MLQRFQQNILEKIARGCSVNETAESICCEAERFGTGAQCSILTVDASGLLHPLAGPSLPAHYSAALEGVPIGPAVGSCGTAAYRAKPVTVVDIMSDPLWAEFKGLVEPLGIKACWSSPILHSEGRVLGTFAFYFKECRGPTEEEEIIVAACVDLCSVMLEREEVRAANHRLAYFDALTGLRNRASFNKALEDVRLTGDEGIGLVLIDLDHLKRVNDTLGHAVGDDLIRELAGRIAKNARSGQAFRIGGDEFAVLAIGNDGEPARIAAGILASTKKPVRSNNRVIAATVTCGGAVSRLVAPGDLRTLQQQADFALYHAKEGARGSFVLYDETLSSTIARRFSTMRRVTNALAAYRLEPFYKPIVRLDTREIIGLEALCRLRTSEGRIVEAAEFVEAMQDLSIGKLVTAQMLNRVAYDIRSWLDRGIPVQHVGVNVTTADFQDRDLYERVSAAFSRHRVPLKHVILEVTESVYMDEGDRKIAHTIERLRADGLLVALDDFGTGYASLTHLLTFPVDIIKVDKSFIGRLSEGDAGQVIVKGLIDIARGLGIRIVAEGVEHEGQSAQLEKLGCILGQGYLFGRPQDFMATTDLVLRFSQQLPTTQDVLAARVA
ncbi:EAL domain-containing protein [uncultured Enterovirga sp.]|uniref:bifunctional diguanylate cyclase/phosphodiesterase n=1 Tax=uncultured Enterovirga sp. TaxID=2026352 RepID=UPI0035CA427C